MRCFWRSLILDEPALGVLRCNFFKSLAAGIERLWSVMNAIHTKGRSRLSFDKVVAATGMKLKLFRDKEALDRKSAQEKAKGDVGDLNFDHTRILIFLSEDEIVTDLFLIKNLSLKSFFQ